MHVELDSFCVSYDGHKNAVDDLSLSIPSGALFGLIGPNGAGKSTTLRAIAGLQRPSAGRVRLDGAVDGDPEFAQRRRKIGFLGEHRPFARGTTTRGYLHFFARAHGLSRKEARERTDELLTMLNLQDKADASCRSLSKGMKQRLALGRACVHRPQLLILDEPADGLDPQGRADLRKTLRKIHEEQTTILISSHILRELDDLCDEVAILSCGKVAVQGRVAEIDQDQAHAAHRYRLELWSSDEDAANAVLERGEAQCVQQGGVIDTTLIQGPKIMIDLELRGGQEAAAKLVTSCVHAQLHVSSMQRAGSRLEDIYEKLADPRVS